MPFKPRLSASLRSAGKKIAAIIRERGLLSKRFSFMMDCLTEFTLRRVLSSPQVARTIAARFLDVLERCDELTFDEEGEAEAYSLLHFADRYHRFQLTYLKMLETGLLPLAPYKLDLLDVGAGPSPALFAAADIYNLVQEIAVEKSLKPLDVLAFHCDYVERSRGFRDWLHRFTEYVNWRGHPKVQWNVPYHHGSFHSIDGLDFSKLKTDYAERLIDDARQEAEDIDAAFLGTADDLDPGWKHKYRYNLITLGYFLSRASQVARWLPEIRSSVFALRNLGILLIVGGHGEHYPKVYGALKAAVEPVRYETNKSISHCTEVPFDEGVMSYPSWSAEGRALRLYHQVLLERLQELGVLESVPRAARKSIERWIHHDRRETRWKVHVFRKTSRARLRRGTPPPSTGDPSRPG